MTNLQSAVEIGSTGIRLLVAEITKDGKRNILDRSELPVALGRDVFTSGIISRETLLKCISILNGIKEQLKTWGLTPSDTITIATSALREAQNRDSIIDRIFVKTEFKVKVIDGIEENRLVYLAVRECLKEESFNMRQQDSLILEVGGGSTEIMLLEKGSIAGAHSLRLGTVIIEQQLKSMLGSLDDAKRYVSEFITNTKGSLNNELNLGSIKQFIAVGAEPKIAAIFAGTPISPSLWTIKRVDFDRFVKQVQTYSPEECVAHFKISYSEAQSFHVSLIAYQLFMKLTGVTEIIVPDTTIRDGIIISKQLGPYENIQQEFYSQIIASAFNLLHKYNGDVKHAEYVRKASCILFDSLKKEIALDYKARTLLELAAILHDIGTFIRSNDHHQHSKYIIEHSDIFGLNKEEIQTVAQISYWHRGDDRKITQDDTFITLPRMERLSILKLTAILRIADSLDRAHTQRITDFKISFTDNTMTILTDGTHHNVLEKIALSEKAGLYESVFGYKVNLV